MVAKGSGVVMQETIEQGEMKKCTGDEGLHNDQNCIETSVVTLC